MLTLKRFAYRTSSASFEKLFDAVRISPTICLPLMPAEQKVEEGVTSAEVRQTVIPNDHVT